MEQNSEYDGDNSSQYDGGEDFNEALANLPGVAPPHYSAMMSPQSIHDTQHGHEGEAHDWNMPPIQAHPNPVGGHQLLIPPPPPMNNMQQWPPLAESPGSNGSGSRPDLPPLMIPENGQGSPSARSPTNDAPLTIDDEHVRFDSDNEEMAD